MSKEVFMPKLSSTMEVGTLLQWYKEVGDFVEVGDPLFEVMTDKINIEVESYEEGILRAKLYEADDQVPVNQVIGYIGEEGEEIPSIKKTTSTIENEPNTVETFYQNEEVRINPTGKVRATPAARKIACENNLNLHEIEGTGPKGRIQKIDVEQHANTQKITPLAKKIADDLGVPTQIIQGTGVHEKITKQDVLASFKPDTENVKTKKLSGMRKTIAQRMSHSAYTAPHVTVQTTVDMTKLKQLREQLLPTVEKQSGHRISYTDLLIKFVSKALQKHPTLNATLKDDVITYHEQINVGIAIALDEGLIVPVLRNTQMLGLQEITALSKELGKKAKKNELLIDHLSGGTFTISNLGNYDIDHFTPIINSPEVAILGVGRIKEQPIVIDGSVEIRLIMGLSLSFDHRVIDGAPAAAYLTDLKHLIENPYELLL
ncbi:MAG: dihydrolipoamide acetyltransferase family protein [Solibacillus sp.]